MRERRVPTIRSTLVLLVLAFVIPASLMAAILISHSYHRERARLVQDCIGTARALVQALDRELTSLRVAGEVLATSPYLRGGDTRAFYEHAQSVMRRQIGNVAVLSDATGQQLVNTLRPPGERLPRHGNPAQLRRVFEAGRPVISDVYIGGVLQKPVVSIDVPVVRDGKVVYDLSIGILPERFLKLLRDQRLPPQWIASVFDSGGTIVARTHEMEQFMGKKGAPALVKRMAEVDEDSLETTTVEGIPVLSAFSRSGVSRWGVAIGIPKSILIEELWGVVGWLVLGVAVLLFGSLGLALAFAGRIARSIRGLTQPALALGFGEVVAPPSLFLKEANEVGQALANASRILREAEHRAHHDVLTGLANRWLFKQFVDEQTAICERTGNALAVLYIDLDGFKAVNDTHGHAAGDELLCAVAARLTSGTRRSDVVARLGGDEFGVALIDTGPDAAARLAGTLAERLSLPYSIGALTLEVSASIGVAAYPSSGTEAETLLRRADEAMYRAKSGGGRRVAVARVAGAA